MENAEFYDDFTETTLNAELWIPTYLPQWSSRDKTYPKYQLIDNKLILQITEDQEPWSEEFNGQVKVSNLQTGVYSGPIGSNLGQHRFSEDLVVREYQPKQRTYTPLYGRFEIRCRVPNLGIDNVAALWMIGFEDQPNRSAEICIVEIIGSKQPENGALIGYGLHPFGDPKIKDEFYEDHFELDIKEFHSYACEWTPEHVDFYIDDKFIRRINQSPDYPMQLMLNLYEVPVDGHDSKSNKYPKEFVIDHVKGSKLPSELTF
ncbi:glycoside hydrolase [Roseivirga sp. 4D4]|uniref:glycoside hydrolase family 16 protein n=1 Tax=Roseivirga sp. 4D4 TaxID=1889784 RepID=UPI00085307CD|nr:glycoside hydrolase family 16 protein [Roseivirga sp. 4D4]OEK01353.1 glycoside hydrolase [Roseivirga sp. 4D4]